MAHPIPVVPYDPEVAGPLAQMVSLMPDEVTVEMLPMLRTASRYPATHPGLQDGTILAAEYSAVAADGHQIVLTSYRRADHQPGSPGVYWIHGGGLIAGDRFTGIDLALAWLDRWDLVVATVEYRLAPEFPYPTPFEDCYRGLEWFAGQADMLGFDPARLAVGGASAGGNLAAAVTLAARDRRGPAIAAQLLMSPMLDDRNVTVSSHQYTAKSSWSRSSNLLGWGCYLGEARGSADVPCYAAPARLTDFSGLPTTYLDGGTAEVFRDEIAAYAQGLWAAGTQAELHLWAGAIHGFSALAPAARVSRQATEAVGGWLRRALDLA